MPRRGAAIGAGEIQHTLKLQGFQGRRYQSRGAAKRIEINETKTSLLQQAARQELLGRQRRVLHRAVQWREIALEQRQAIGIGIIGPHRLRS
jgi:hypothetical protein